MKSRIASMAAVVTLLALLAAWPGTALRGAQEPASPQGMRGTPPAAQPAIPGRGISGTGRGMGGPVLAPLNAAAIERAAPVLAEARKALGGDKLTALKTLLVTGRTKRLRGNNLVPIEFEIAMELPDKYVRKDEVPAEESEPTSTGFAGDQIIQFPAPGPTGPMGRMGAPGAAPNPEQIEMQRRMRLTTVKQDFARLVLGLFADSTAAYPLTFGYAGQGAAPQGTADVLDVRGEGNFGLRLFISSQTHLPIMVSWQAPPTGVSVATPGQSAPATIAPGVVVVNAPVSPAANASPEEKDAYQKQIAALRQRAQTTPVEYRIYYADYRAVDGLQLPFRLRRAIGPDTTEETTFDRFRLNTRLDSRKFTVK